MIKYGKIKNKLDQMRTKQTGEKEARKKFKEHT